MTIFKCKMCGGTIEFEQGATVGVCDSCGTKQTLPRLDDEKKVNLYDRANHFRRNNDYDKAMEIYNRILNEDNTDAEAYWSIVLCRYGIEYVEDPATRKRVPTVNRAQFTSVYADEDYKSAIACADVYQKSIYEEEAKAIDEIQKGILAISQKEEPFDVFICYKETDANGRRTQDSVLANDLYHQLTQEGFKVFFSRITLEDKLGTAYEPYIFAALNSAKVMVVIGTKAEYYNAVWVKNEWSRYMALIRNGAKKMLIPAYRDMDPYDLPEEFSHLQAQDMSKLGFMQDLIRGIKKIIGSEAPKEAIKETVVVNSNSNTAPLLKRAFMFLEDGEWQDADEYCEKVLDQDPENAQAYLGKLMAELKVRKQEDLKDCADAFDGRNNYQKTIRFADDSLADALKGYISHINERNEQARINRIYNNAVTMMNEARCEEDYKKAAGVFGNVPGFNDADALAEACLEKAEVCRKDDIYNSAKRMAVRDRIEPYEEAIALFSKVSGWKDADEQVALCQKRVEEIKMKEEQARIEAEREAEERRISKEKAAKRRKIVFGIGTLIAVACIVFAIVLTTMIIPNNKYNSAVSLMNDEKYDEAIKAFKALNGYKDSEKQIEKCYIGKNGEENWNAKVGDTFTFGAYEQDNNASNGKEAIEWIVLEKEGKSLLLISKQALDCQRYNTTVESMTWENSDLRRWTNGSFLNNAFSAEERARIQSTIVSADKNPKYGPKPGNETTDKVFLLSIVEAEKYFTTDELRKCAPTAYAKAQGAWTRSCDKTSNGEVTCLWWLRSPGRRKDMAATVYTDGSVFYDGNDVETVINCVRPALWINLES